MSSRLNPLKVPTIKSIVWKATQLVGAAVLFKDYIAEGALCSGESMLPTLNSKGDVVLVEKISPAFKCIKRGDCVVCVSPEDPDKLICKRVIGLEDDIIAVPYGGIFTSQKQIPKGHVWIEGDNSAKSRDSRDFGTVPYGLIRGKVLCKIWPLKEFGISPNNYKSKGSI